MDIQEIKARIFIAVNNYESALADLRRCEKDLHLYLMSQARESIEGDRSKAMAFRAMAKMVTGSRIDNAHEMRTIIEQIEEAAYDVEQF